MITQADITTGAYFYLVAGGIITSMGAVIVYLLKSKKHDSK